MLKGSLQACLLHSLRRFSATIETASITVLASTPLIVHISSYVTEARQLGIIACCSTRIRLAAAAELWHVKRDWQSFLDVINLCYQEAVEETEVWFKLCGELSTVTHERFNIAVADRYAGQLARFGLVQTFIL